MSAFLPGYIYGVSLYAEDEKILDKIKQNPLSKTVEVTSTGLLYCAAAEFINTTFVPKKLEGVFSTLLLGLATLHVYNFIKKKYYKKNSIEDNEEEKDNEDNEGVKDNEDEEDNENTLKY